QLVLERGHAGGLGLGLLGADIDLARRVVADQDHRKARHQIVLALDAGDLVGHARPEVRGNDFSIDDLGRHVSSLGLSIWPKQAGAGLRQAAPDRRRPRSASAARSLRTGVLRWPWGRQAISP